MLYTYNVMERIAEKSINEFKFSFRLPSSQLIWIISEGLDPNLTHQPNPDSSIFGILSNTIEW